jgi:hypothetical protein
MKYYCIIGFYLFLAFQRHLICKILSYETISMNFRSLSYFLKF